jgi:hypothetical protein
MPPSRNFVRQILQGGNPGNGGGNGNARRADQAGTGSPPPRNRKRGRSPSPPPGATGHHNGTNGGSGSNNRPRTSHSGPPHESDVIRPGRSDEGDGNVRLADGPSLDHQAVIMKDEPPAPPPPPQPTEEQPMGMDIRAPASQHPPSSIQGVNGSQPPHQQHLDPNPPPDPVQINTRRRRVGDHYRQSYLRRRRRRRQHQQGPSIPGGGAAGLAPAADPPAELAALSPRTDPVALWEARVSDVGTVVPALLLGLSAFHRGWEWWTCRLHLESPLVRTMLRYYRGRDRRHVRERATFRATKYNPLKGRFLRYRQAVEAAATAGAATLVRRDHGEGMQQRQHQQQQRHQQQQQHPLDTTEPPSSLSSCRGGNAVASVSREPATAVHPTGVPFVPGVAQRRGDGTRTTALGGVHGPTPERAWSSAPPQQRLREQLRKHPQPPAQQGNSHPRPSQPTTPEASSHDEEVRNVPPLVAGEEEGTRRALLGGEVPAPPVEAVAGSSNHRQGRPEAGHHPSETSLVLPVDRVGGTARLGAVDETSSYEEMDDTDDNDDDDDDDKAVDGAGGADGGRPRPVDATLKPPMKIHVPWAAQERQDVGWAAPPARSRPERRDGPPPDEGRDHEVRRSGPSSHRPALRHHQQLQQQQPRQLPAPEDFADRRMPYIPQEDQGDFFLLDGPVLRSDSLPTTIYIHPEQADSAAFDDTDVGATGPDAEELTPVSPFGLLEYHSPDSRRQPEQSTHVEMRPPAVRQGLSGTADLPRLDSRVGRDAFTCNSNLIRRLEGLSSPKDVPQDQRRPPDPPGSCDGDNKDQRASPAKTNAVPCRQQATSTARAPTDTEATTGAPISTGISTNQRGSAHDAGIRPINPYLRRPQANRDSERAIVIGPPNVAAPQRRPLQEASPLQPPRTDVNDSGPPLEVDKEDDHHWECSADPTAASEILLSQFQPPYVSNSSSRRVTLSPNVLAPGKMIDPAFPRDVVAASAASHIKRDLVGGNPRANGRHDTTDRAWKDPPPTAAMGWISNEPGRNFVHDKAQSLKPPAVVTDRYRGKENPRPKGCVARDNDNSVGGRGRHNNSPMPAASRAGPTVAGDKKNESMPAPSASGKGDDQSLWSDEDRDRPNYKYQEVVRKRAEREGLKPYDCPECAAFVDMILQGDGAKVYNRDELMCCSRHRSRHTPPSTPPDFWELSFIDECDKKMQEKLGAASGRQDGKGEEEVGSDDQ